MLAYGLSGAALDYIDRPLQRTRNLEDKWSRERKLIAAKLKRPTEFAKYSVTEELRAVLPVVFAAMDVEEILHVPVDEFVAASPQLELWSDAAFSPSATLLDFWKTGIAFHLAAARKDEIKALSGATFSQTMRAQFSEQLIGAIISEFRSLRGSDATYHTFVSRAGEFEPRIEIMLSNVFPIRPADLSAFLKQLAQELVEYFSNGFQLAGEWGRVVAKSGEVVVNLTAIEWPVYEKANKRAIDIDL